MKDRSFKVCEMNRLVKVKEEVKDEPLTGLSGWTLQGSDLQD